jgi:hypothetical protein
MGPNQKRGRENLNFENKDNNLIEEISKELGNEKGHLSVAL